LIIQIWQRTETDLKHLRNQCPNDLVYEFAAPEKKPPVSGAMMGFHSEAKITIEIDGFLAGIEGFSRFQHFQTNPPKVDPIPRVDNS